MTFELMIDRVVNFFNKLSPIYILVPSGITIGNTSQEIYYGLLLARRQKKKILFLRMYQIGGWPKICNKALYEIRSPYIATGMVAGCMRVLGNALLTVFRGHPYVTLRYVFINAKNLFLFLVRIKPEFKYTGRWSVDVWPYYGHSPLWNPKQLSRFDWNAVHSVDWAKDYEEGLPIAFDPTEEQKATAELREMGIGPNDWFVCLHVREGGFWGNYSTTMNGSNESPRNSDPLKCVDAIKAITDRGGFVIRLGDKTMTPLPKMDRVIDYPFTKYKSEFMDLFLLKNCRFFFGTNSGVREVAFLFQKRSLLINLTDICYNPLPRKDSIGITRHVFSKKHGRYLSVRELLDEPYTSQDLTSLSDNYIFRENSPEEIKEFVVENMERKLGPETFTELQRAFAQKRKAQVHRWIDEEMNDCYLGFRYTVAAYSDSSQSTLSQKFLEKYWEKAYTG